MNILTTILARKGSKGVAGKNKKVICGKPLIQWTLEQARASEVSGEIVVSSDDEDIIRIAEELGVDLTLIRPDEHASDRSSKVMALRDCVNKTESALNKKYDVIIDLDVTSPLRLPTDIDNALDVFKKNKATNVITGAKSRRSPYFNLVEINKDQKVNIKNVTQTYGVLVLVGPQSRSVLSQLTNADLSNEHFPWLKGKEISINGISVRALRINYLGELGWELHHPMNQMEKLYKGLMVSGKKFSGRKYLCL